MVRSIGFNYSTSKRTLYLLEKIIDTLEDCGIVVVRFLKRKL